MPWALVAALLFLGATPAFAAAEESSPLDVNVGLMIWTLIIFVSVLVALRRFAWPNILGAVERREAHIRELLDATRREREEAAAMLEENRRILDETRARVQEAMNETRTTGERMRAEMMAETRREQDAMLERARRDIAAERQAALDAVRREAVDVSMAAAERLVRRNLDGEDNRRLVREFLGQMSGAPATAAGL
jgi:F-type H+-transporting ATPase subunit b